MHRLRAARFGRHEKRSRVYYVNENLKGLKIGWFASPTAVKPHQIAVDTCSGFNIIARTSLPLELEPHKVSNTLMPRLAGAEKSSLAPPVAVWLHVRLANNLYRVQFFIADRLSVRVLLGNLYNICQVTPIDIGNQRLILRPKRIVPIFSLEKQNTELESSPEPSKKSLPRKRFELDTDVFETHIVRLTRRLVIPAHTQAIAQAITAARDLLYVESRPSMQISREVRLANGVHAVVWSRPFEFLVANFSRVERILLKGMFIDAARRNPLALLTPEPNVAQEVALAHNIVQVPCEERDPTGIGSREERHAVDKSRAVSSSEK